MKLRIGFVSNSSTSSFIICGFKLESDTDYARIVKKLLNFTDEDLIDQLKETQWFRNNPDKEIMDDDIEGYCYKIIQDSSSSENEFVVETGEGIDGTIVGLRLAKVDSELGGAIDNSEHDIVDLQNKMDVLKEKLDISEDISPKVYTGTTAC